jgi:hypothetical protein
LPTRCTPYPLATAQALRGVFVSDDSRRVDAENVLFYNLDARSFAGAPRCIRFEPSWEAAPPPPVALIASARHHHVYEGVDAAEGFRSWTPSELVARLRDEDGLAWHVIAARAGLKAVAPIKRLYDEASGEMPDVPVAGQLDVEPGGDSASA